MLMRVAALAVVPRVIRILKRSHPAEAQLPASTTTDQRVEEPAPAVETTSRVRKAPTRRWQISPSVKAESPSFPAWWSPTSVRAPPFAGTKTRSRVYLHRRSFPINRVDPSGLQPPESVVDRRLNLPAPPRPNAPRAQREPWLAHPSGTHLTRGQICSVSDLPLQSAGPLSPEFVGAVVAGEATLGLGGRLLAAGPAHYVYRGLAEGESTAAGLTARAPGVETAIASHVGGKRVSSWISTSKCESIARNPFGKHGVVKIDLRLVTSKVEDISKGIPGYPPHYMLSRWAAKMQEVLIENHVPPEAVEHL